jgi:hypothetical protein
VPLMKTMKMKWQVEWQCRIRVIKWGQISKKSDNGRLCMLYMISRETKGSKE